jgi:hypothetical protein
VVPTAAPAIAPPLRGGDELFEFVGAAGAEAVGEVMTRVGERVDMAAFLVISTGRSAASKPDMGVVVFAPPVPCPPTAVRMLVGTM